MDQKKKAKLNYVNWSVTSLVLENSFIMFRCNGDRNGKI